MHRDTIHSDLAADANLVQWNQVVSPRAAAQRAWKIALSVALLAAGPADFAQPGPSPWQSGNGFRFADLDADGDLDPAVNALGGGTRLFLNDGAGHFTEVTQQVGLASHSASMALAVADYDGDGNLDLYMTNYRSSGRAVERIDAKHPRDRGEDLALRRGV